VAEELEHEDDENGGRDCWCHLEILEKQERMNKPLAKFALDIRTSKDGDVEKKLYVAIWRHLKDMRVAAKQVSPNPAGFWKEAAGCYVDIRSKSQFGEIYLWKKMMGAGYVAHEIQHFILAYMEETETWPLSPQANERMAWMAGDLMAQFWSKFYELPVGIQ
jgi:hypothetical protein